MEKVSRRSALLTAFGGVAGLAVAPASVLAAPAQQTGTKLLPTVVWAAGGTQRAELKTFWPAPPERLQANHTFRPHGYHDRRIVVSPDRLVQLRDGTMLSFVAWRRAGTWHYGLADLHRVAREGWKERALTARGSLSRSQLLSRAATALEGRSRPLSVLSQPSVPVRQR